jgi:cation transport regulator ChaC
MPTESSVEQWIFAYGSLIWNPEFACAEQMQATAAGYTRRFWQASHDHRGTPDAPGRVVTLVPMTQQKCVGLAYRLHATMIETVLNRLDHREQDGYRRVVLSVVLEDRRVVNALTWIAASDNASWLGNAPHDEIVKQIACRGGPSGSNQAYLLKLADALEALTIRDSHVEALARGVRKVNKLTSN